MSSSSFLQSSALQTFHPFPRLPAEIQAQIWQASIRPHIIRWIRIDDEAENSSNLFTSSTRSLPLLSVSRGAREAMLFNSILLQPPRRTWFFPLFDYLHLDPAWTNLRDPGLKKDPLDSLPFHLKLIRKIMVHPNYTESRLRPGVLLERMPLLETILVVADEKSIGVQRKFMLASVYDLQKYFEGVKREHPEANIPYIAVGCLGWVGDERRKSYHHRDDDGRQLVAVFDGESQMKEHLKAMREEEVKFLKDTFNHWKPSLTLHFRAGQSMDTLRLDSTASTSKAPDSSNDSPPKTPEAPEMQYPLPTYSQAVAEDSNRIEGENSPVQL